VGSIRSGQAASHFFQRFKGLLAEAEFEPQIERRCLKYCDHDEQCGWP